MAYYNAVQMGCLIKEIQIGGTPRQIADSLGYNYYTIAKYMRIWHQQGIVYIHHWSKPTLNTRAKFYKLRTSEYQKDAKKPESMSQEIANQRSYIKKLRARGRFDLANRYLEQRRLAA